jgi:hypothetical protein
MKEIKPFSSLPLTCSKVQCFTGVKKCGLWMITVLVIF